MVKEKLQRYIAYSQFFFKLSSGRFFIGFIGQHHSSGSDIPTPRIDILGSGSFLQKEFILIVKNKDIARTRDQLIGTHASAGLLADFSVMAVNYLDNFVVLGCHGFIWTV